METSLRMPQIQSNRPVLLTAVYKHSRARYCVILKPYSAWHLTVSQRILVKLDIGKSSPVVGVLSQWLVELKIYLLRESNTESTFVISNVPGSWFVSDQISGEPALLPLVQSSSSLRTETIPWPPAKLWAASYSAVYGLEGVLKQPTEDALSSLGGQKEERWPWL